MTPAGRGGSRGGRGLASATAASNLGAAPAERGAVDCDAADARGHTFGAVGSARSDRGSATVLLLAIIAVAFTLALGGLALARAAHARGAAQSAADLAAIAAAGAAHAEGAPCAVAAAVTDANGARLTACELQPGGFVVVSAAVTISPLPGWSTVATAQARAGPVL